LHFLYLHRIDAKGVTRAFGDQRGILLCFTQTLRQQRQIMLEAAAPVAKGLAGPKSARDDIRTKCTCNRAHGKRVYGSSFQPTSSQKEKARFSNGLD
jgi:hypothetical protein